jgi:transposase-like protein
MGAYRVFKAEFRISIAQRILNGESVGSLSDRYKIKRSVLYRWRDLLRDQGRPGAVRRSNNPFTPLLLTSNGPRILLVAGPLAGWYKGITWIIC